jgi:Receptor family ligand binding region
MKRRAHNYYCLCLLGLGLYSLKHKSPGSQHKQPCFVAFGAIVTVESHEVSHTVDPSMLLVNDSFVLGGGCGSSHGSRRALESFAVNGTLLLSSLDSHHPAYYDGLRTILSYQLDYYKQLQTLETVNNFSSSPFGYFDVQVKDQNSTGSAQSTNSSAVYEVSVRKTENGTTTASSEDRDVYRVVDVKAFVPFAVDGDLRPNSMNDAFAIMLAVHHFNNPHLSPFLTNNDDSQSSVKVKGGAWDLGACNVRLTLDMFDTRFNPFYATSTYNALLRDSKSQEYEQQRLLNQLDLSDEELEVFSWTSFAVAPRIGGVIGAHRSAVTAPLAILSSVRNIPHISHASTAADFNEEEYPMFGRTVASTEEEAQAAIAFFKKELNATHVAMLYIAVSRCSASWKRLSIVFYTLTLCCFVILTRTHMERH